MNYKQEIGVQIATDTSSITNIGEQNNFTINDSFLNQIITSLHSSKRDSANNLLKAFHRMIENGNFDPEWKYKIEFRGEQICILEEPISEAVTNGLPKRIEVKIMKPSEYESFGNIKEVVDYGQKNKFP